MDNELLRCSQAKKVTWVGFLVNSFLTALKLFAGFTGNSGAMIADGVHSLSDFLTDIVVLVGFNFIEKPEDEDHNYGHGKYETFATIIISIFLLIVGVGIFKTGFEKIISIINGSELSRPGVRALFAAMISIISKELLYRYTIRIGKDINSSAVIANGWHHRSDAFSSVGTLLGIGGALILGHKWIILDPLASIIVSLFIFKVAAEIFAPAMNELMEKSLEEDEKKQIIEIISECDEIESYHQLRTRKIGCKVAIEFHILVNANINIAEAHGIATKVENKIKDIFGRLSIVTIHIEPYLDSEIIKYV
ncbi:cation diffusion facilitator family transporter [Clostridium grantii]|uniref:Cation diffusion facilitator family transporter n=1 Tax=Clostridium grantii DSM 8605 TaxID=1121316 RepID=A0A1M5UZD7_9CLOT|nr:cation diffusion facilitator family transporter [Clostridium grantii]SHH68053.1 cation diffusion facilitator family transporter [Clostridium grantii DSM 8605]